MADTIPARLFEQARRRPGSPAYYEHRDGEYAATSWSAYAAQVERAAKALIALGFAPGDRATVMGFNRPEWVVFDLAVMAAGGAPAGIYATTGAEEAAYVNRHSGAPITLVENEQQLGKVLAQRDRTPGLQWIVTMRGAPLHDDPSVLAWDEFLARGDGVPDADLAARLDGLEPGGLATLVYTSGTTGPPKGVMLSHANLTWTADQGIDLFSVTPGERLVSYLPLSHIAEQMFTIHLAVTVGYAVYFAEAIERLPDNIREARPTVFFGVPRVWERFRAGIQGELAKASGAKAAAARWAMARLRANVHATNEGGAAPLPVALAARAADLIGARVREAVGLGDTRLVISGAAPISTEVLEFFAGFGLSIMEVYGLSETTGPAAYNHPGGTRFGTAGPPYPGVEIRIAPDGEVLVRGGNVFMGYYDDPEATAAALAGGWLATGDLGSLDGDGYLTITGRKKDLIVTAGGKNVSPQNLEGAIEEHPLIGDAVVVGDGRSHLAALLFLDPDAAAAWAADRGAEGPLHLSPEVREEVAAAVDACNEGRAPVEHVRAFRIMPRPLTIEEGELTGTLKVRRDVVTDHFAAEIEGLYR
ncbi:MAG: AMP-dependent synthetase/ligase [Actinobacteria bacterium]|nr:AMP-dependent synthetase/ligase [Actinomycetota bacterium]